MNPKLQAFVGYLASEVGASDNTIEAYRGDVVSLEKWLGDKPLYEASTDDLRMYLQDQTRHGMSPSTITRRIATFRLFYRFIGLNVAVDLERPKRDDDLPHTLSRTQVDALIAAPPSDTPLGVRNRAILELIYAAGLRASELCGLGMTDISMVSGWVRVFGKGNKERVVPIGRCSIDTLIVYLRDARPTLDKGLSDRMFLSTTGNVIDRHSLWVMVHRYAKQSGVLNDVGPHTLRHCFASHLVSGGADLRTVQELLGHSDIGTTQRYIHVDADRLKAVHRNFHPRP